MIRRQPFLRKTPMKRSRNAHQTPRSAISRTKGRKASISTLKKKLWKIFSEYIRFRDADPQTGLVKCISCPTVKHWKEMDCGHYIPKSLGLAIYFEPRNCAPQCQKCNCAFQGNQYPYALALIDRYGPTILEELAALQRTTLKIKSWRYLELIKEYQDKILQLGWTDRELDA